MFKTILFMFALLRNAQTNNFCYPNNVCSTFKGYLNPIFSKDCFCVQDVDKDPDVVSKNLIGESEFHEIKTEDGYILGVFRLRRKNPKGVVILHHPMTVSSRIWLNYGNKSIAYAFWQKGYDVWMPNNRGTQYSNKHVNLTSKDPAYWDFTFHEIGLYDHKPMIDFIYEKTKQKIFFVTQSMSTTSILIYSAMHPDDANEKLEVVFGISPCTFMKNVNTRTKVFARLAKPISMFFKAIGWHSFLKWDAWYITLGQWLVLPFPFKFVFVKLTNFLSGPTPKQFDPVLINLFVISGLDEVSWKTIYHFAQIVLSSGRFQMYDYGKKTNLKLYGKKQPPLYPLEDITVPIYLMYSKQDIISVFKDNQDLYEKLPNQAKVYGKYELNGFNHLDYQGGKDRFKFVFNHIFKQMEYISTNAK